MSIKTAMIEALEKKYEVTLQEQMQQLKSI